MAIDTLLFACVVEAEICHTYNDPIYKGSDGDEILEPREDCGCRVGKGHVAKNHEEGIHANCYPRTKHSTSGIRSYRYRRD